MTPGAILCLIAQIVADTFVPLFVQGGAGVMRRTAPARPAWLGPDAPESPAQSRRRLACAVEVMNLLRARGVQRDDRLRILTLALGHEIAQVPAGQLTATMQWCGALIGAAVAGSQRAQQDQLAAMPPQGHG